MSDTTNPDVKPDPSVEPQPVLRDFQDNPGKVGHDNEQVPAHFEPPAFPTPHVITECKWTGENVAEVDGFVNSAQWGGTHQDENVKHELMIWEVFEKRFVPVERGQTIYRDYLNHCSLDKEKLEKLQDTL